MTAPQHHPSSCPTARWGLPTIGMRGLQRSGFGLVVFLGHIWIWVSGGYKQPFPCHTSEPFDLANTLIWGTLIPPGSANRIRNAEKSKQGISCGSVRCAGWAWRKKACIQRPCHAFRPAPCGVHFVTRTGPSGCPHSGVRLFQPPGNPGVRRTNECPLPAKH